MKATHLQTTMSLSLCERSLSFNVWVDGGQEDPSGSGSSSPALPSDEERSAASALVQLSEYPCKTVYLATVQQGPSVLRYVMSVFDTVTWRWYHKYQVVPGPQTVSVQGPVHLQLLTHCCQE